MTTTDPDVDWAEDLPEDPDLTGELDVEIDEPWSASDRVWIDGDVQVDEAAACLFDGDEGGLEVAQRKCLVTLLKHRFITIVSHPREWATLVADPSAIRRRLNDLFLELVLDTGRQVAFKRQAVPDGGGKFPTLLYDTPWGREDTVLMVSLRLRSRADEMAGLPATFVDRADLVEHLEAMRPAGSTDHSGDTRKTNAAIERLLTAGLLLGHSTADRFQVSPALDAILPLEKLQDLLAWLRRQNGTDLPGLPEVRPEPGAEPGEPGTDAAPTHPTERHA